MPRSISNVSEGEDALRTHWQEQPPLKRRWVPFVRSMRGTEVGRDHPDDIAGAAELRRGLARGSIAAPGSPSSSKVNGGEGRR
jgi:hypothetical protein